MNPVALDPVDSFLVDDEGAFRLDPRPPDAVDDTKDTASPQGRRPVAAVGVEKVTILSAVVLQTAYRGLIWLWSSFAMALILVAETVTRAITGGVRQLRLWLKPRTARPRRAATHEVRLTFSELALIYKSLQAAKTLGALPPQDELLEDTIHVIDQRLNGFAH